MNDILLDDILDTEAEDNDYFDDVEDIDNYGEDLADYYVEDVDDFYDEDIGEEGDDEDDYFSEELEVAEASLWPDEDELEAFEMAEAADYLTEDYIPEVFAQYEPDMFDDSAELAEVLREVLHEDYQDASPEEMQEALFNILETMTPAEGFSFKNILRQIRKVGKKVLRNPIVGQIAGKALPIFGGALGTFIGGPVGTALGAKLGQAAAKAFSGGRRSAAKGSKASPKGGSAAAAQLLQLTQNPNMLKSLLALALGSQGKKSIQVGKSGPSVPVGGFMNLLSTLVGKAAADADELLRESTDASAYMRDSNGEFLVDPAVPEDRAQTLYDSLIMTENQELAAEAAERYRGPRRYRYKRRRRHRYRKPPFGGYRRSGYY